MFSALNDPNEQIYFADPKFIFLNQNKTIFSHPQILIFKQKSIILIFLDDNSNLTVHCMYTFLQELGQTKKKEWQDCETFINHKFMIVYYFSIVYTIHFNYYI